jgi:hypothetical protein
MYTYKYSVGRYKNYRPGYHIVDIKDYSVADLEKLFDILYIVINDGFYKVDMSISLEDYRFSFAANPTMDIGEWLTSQNGNNLKSAGIFPGDTYQYVKLERIFTYGYFHYPADLNLANDRQADLFSDMAPDVRIAHYMYDNVDYGKINDYSLFTVNGVFMRSVSRSDGIFLKGAGLDYIKHRNDLRIGALNFEKLGKVKTVPITEDILLEEEFDGGKRLSCQLDDIVNKTIYIVVNGQLMVDTNIVYRVAENRVAINLASFDVAHHYLNYKEYTRTPKLTVLSKFETYKRQALLAHNSFFVIVDNPSLGIDVVPLTTFHYPNALHTSDRFQHPVVLDNGMFPTPYIRTYGIKQRLLNHDLRVYKKYPFMTAGALGGNVLLDDAINQGDPGSLSKGWMFKIHGVTLKAS